MPYQILAPSLWGVADSVRKYLKEVHGLSSIRTEEELAADVPRPTLYARSSDQTIICADIYEDSCFPQSAELFVSRCSVQQLPVRYYTAFIEGNEAQDYARQLRQAKIHGIGVLSVNVAGNVTVLSDPLTLTLANVRKLEIATYPRPYRDRLARAQQTYLQGDPVKGCAGIHEILEEVTRTIAKKLHASGRIGAWASRTPNFDRDPWYGIANAIYTDPTFSTIFPGTSPAVWADLIAKTKPRNEGAHPPSNQKQRAKRDREMRTRFESAADILNEVFSAMRRAGL